MENGVDDSYTNHIRNEIDSGRSFHGPVFTPDEIDSLLDDDITGAYEQPTLLAQAAVMRSTGIKVDMATSGAARSNVFRAGASTNQEHNTFRATFRDDQARVYGPNCADKDTIPKVTPQDTNYATKSLDHPQTRPKPMPLDNMRIESTEEPIEASFINAVSTLQAAKMLGADVTDMEKFVDASWGINFTSRLVNEAALAPVAELSAWVASGGRPPPVMFVSPNVASRWVIDSSPMTGLREVGYSAAFTGRSRALTKFIAYSVNIFRGRGALSELLMHMNANQLSQVPIQCLTGEKLSPHTRPEPAYGRTSVTNTDSFEDFTGARVSAARAIRNHDLNLAKDTAIVSDHLSYRVKAARVLHEIVKSSAVMMPLDSARSMGSHPNEAAAPSKLMAILLGDFHGTATAERYMRVMSASDMLAIMSQTPTAASSFPPVWGLITHECSFAGMLKAVNVSRCAKHGDLKDLLAANPLGDQHRLSCIYLLNRCSRQLTTTIAVALEDIRMKCLTRPDDVIATANMPRVLKELQRYLAARKVPPHHHIVRYAGTMANESSHTSALLMDITKLAASENLGMEVPPKPSKVRSKDQARKDKAKAMSQAKFGRSRMKPLISGVRMYWVSHYSARAKDLLRAAQVAMKLAGGPSIEAHDLKDVGTWEEGFDTSIRMAIATIQEWIYQSALSLGYRYCAIDFHGIAHAPMKGRREEEIIHSTVKAYKDALMAKKVVATVDMKADQLNKNSALAEGMERTVSSGLNKMGLDPGLENTVERLMMDSYKTLAPVIVATFDEMVANDYDMLEAEWRMPASGSDSEDSSEEECVGKRAEGMDLDMYGKTDFASNAAVAQSEEKEKKDKLLIASFSVELVDDQMASALRDLSKNMSDADITTHSAAVDSLIFACTGLSMYEEDESELRAVVATFVGPPLDDLLALLGKVRRGRSIMS